MMDIVERLRLKPSDQATQYRGNEPWRLQREAADTIERLRAELALLKDQEPVRFMVTTMMPGGSTMWDVVEHEMHARMKAEKQEGKDARVVPLYAAPVPVVGALRDAIQVWIDDFITDAWGVRTCIGVDDVQRALEQACIRPAVDRDPDAAYFIDGTGCEHMSRDVSAIEKNAKAVGSDPEVVYLYAAPKVPS